MESGKEVQDGASLTEEEITQKGYKKEEIPNNSEEVKTEENYKTSKKLIEKRLEKSGIANYISKLDENTGEIIIEIPEEGETTDKIVSNINATGKFEITDSQTNEVLMDNNSIKQARVMYGSGGSSDSIASNGTAVYLDIEFNKEGAKKLEEISNEYKENEEEKQEENTAEQDTANEEKEKKISLKIDDSEIMSTNFDEPIKTGRLQLSIGSSTTDNKTLRGYIDQAASMANLLDTGKLPVKYNIDENQYILANIDDMEVQMLIYIILGIIIIALIVLVVRYKKVGLLGIISYIGYISLLLIVIKYVNVVLSIEGILAILIGFILNYILVSKLLGNVEKKEKGYKEFFIKMIPVIITTITFCFINWTPISSFGMTMFWSIALIAIYNSIVTNSLLKINTIKE